MTAQLAILRAAALLIPRDDRTDWLAEWQSELWYARSAGHRKATAFCFGAFHDALWLRRNNLPSRPPGQSLLSPPLACILLLAGLAAISLLAAVYAPGSHGVSSWVQRRFLDSHVLPHLLVILIALIILPTTTSLSIGEYPLGPHSRSLARKSARWIFGGVKIACLLLIVSCGVGALASFWPPIEGQVSLIGYVLAFRWALIDQRRRCPVCLRFLTNPTPIGAGSQTFLAWYGTELICRQGHGLLYVSEIPTSCYSAQRWQYLDPSWSSLFPRA